jgi:hypothetical protein
MKISMMHVVLLGLSACVVEDADQEGAAVLQLEVATAATETNLFSTEVTGSFEVQYASADPATIEFAIDGAVVETQTFDVSEARTATFAADLPLAEGPNEIDVRLRYHGESLARSLVVGATMTAPTITLPTWTSTFTPDVGLTITGDIGVTADGAYQVLDVATSIDGGSWTPAVDGANGWAATLTDPDIGRSDVAVRVTLGLDEHRLVTVVHDSVDVAPVFDCGDSDSMAPTTRMLRSNATEQRIMRGYFGRPDGGHDVSFVISGDAEQGFVTVVSSTTAYARTSIHAAWVVGALRCDGNGNDCDLPYDLEVLVDGVSVCSQTHFGDVRSFN